MCGQVCEEAGIPVHLHAPLLKDFASVPQLYPPGVLPTPSQTLISLGPTLCCLVWSGHARTIVPIVTHVR